MVKEIESGEENVYVMGNYSIVFCWKFCIIVLHASL